MIITTSNNFRYSERFTRSVSYDLGAYIVMEHCTTNVLYFPRCTLLSVDKNKISFDVEFTGAYPRGEYNYMVTNIHPNLMVTGCYGFKDAYFIGNALINKLKYLTNKGSVLVNKPYIVHDGESWYFWKNHVASWGILRYDSQGEYTIHENCKKYVQYER